MIGDSAHGVGLLVASKDLWLFHLEVAHPAESSEWWNLESLLENFRAPVMHAKAGEGSAFSHVWWPKGRA
jgi:hypothetical protein